MRKGKSYLDHLLDGKWCLDYELKSNIIWVVWLHGHIIILMRSTRVWPKFHTLNLIIMASVRTKSTILKRKLLMEKAPFPFKCLFNLSFRRRILYRYLGLLLYLSAYLNKYDINLESLLYCHLNKYNVYSCGRSKYSRCAIFDPFVITPLVHIGFLFR